MDLKRTPPQISNAAAEEVRALNHRTLDPKAFAQPGDVSDVVNALMVLVQRLPQALQQAEAGLRALEGRDAIRMDNGYGSQQELAAAVSNAVFGMSEARGFLERAHDQLKDAASPLSHMGGLWEDDEDDGEG
jgi:hypothetical protein